MNAAVQKILASKRAYRRKLAARPLAEKLSMMEELSERARTTRNHDEKAVPDAPWAIPPNWRWARMQDLATVAGGGTPRTDRSEYFGGKVPWITPADLSKYTQKMISQGARNITEAGLENSGARLLPAGTVLFSSRAPIGYVAIAANPVSTNQGFKSFILNPELLPDFVYYYLKRAKDLAVSMASGTTFQEISGKNAARLPIPVPPLKEQRRIVAEIEKQFTRLDAGVEGLKRAQANLKRYRASILKAACEGQLVPTEAELARRSPADLQSASFGRKSRKPSAPDFKSGAFNKKMRTPDFESGTFETGAALLQRILAERRQKWLGRGKYKEPAALDKTNLPELPTGWTWATVEQLAAPDLNSITDGPFGSNLKTAHYTDDGPRVIRLQNIGDGIYIDEQAHISQAHFMRLSKHRVFANDLVIAGFSENPPRACIIPDIVGPAIVKADCIRFKPHKNVIVKYVHAALNSEPVRKRTKSMVHGIGRPRLNLGEIKSIALPLPPLAEQKRIVEEVERRLSVIKEMEATIAASLARATHLRQAILQRAFSGELASNHP